jgi:hypothetical protein
MGDNGDVETIERHLAVAAGIDVKDQCHVALACVGRAVSGAAGETRQGQTTSQLQFSK